MKKYILSVMPSHHLAGQEVMSVFFLVLFFLCGQLFAGQPGILVLLRPVGDYESAPHGEGNIYAPSVLVDHGVWKMWYAGQGKDGHDRISYAESLDGKSWIKKGVVLEDPDANHINDPSVLKVADNSYLMYYTRAEKYVIDRIHVAVSKDGIHWKPKGIALDAGPKNSWDALSVGRPSVIRENGLFKMWYDGRKDFAPGSPVEGVPFASPSHRYVGYATSKDGFHWKRQSNSPVFGNDAGGLDVKRVGSVYLMLYESHGGTRYAKSKNGIQWQDGDWLVRKSGDAIDLHGHVTPFLLVNPDSTALLFFGAARAATWDRNVIAVSEVNKKTIDSFFE